MQDFIIPQMRGEELEKVLQFERPQTLLENLLQASGKEKPIARYLPAYCRLLYDCYRTAQPRPRVTGSYEK